jgi:hypothetical protein
MQALSSLQVVAHNLTNASPSVHAKKQTHTWHTHDTHMIYMRTCVPLYAYTHTHPPHLSETYEHFPQNFQGIVGRHSEPAGGWKQTSLLCVHKHTSMHTLHAWYARVWDLPGETIDTIAGCYSRMDAYVTSSSAFHCLDKTLFYIHMQNKNVCMHMETCAKTLAFLSASAYLCASLIIFSISSSFSLPILFTILMDFFFLDTWSCVRTCVCVCVCVQIYVCVCVCIYIYIYIYTHTWKNIQGFMSSTMNTHTCIITPHIHV